MDDHQKLLGLWCDIRMPVHEAQGWLKAVESLHRYANTCGYGFPGNGGDVVSRMYSEVAACCRRAAAAADKASEVVKSLNDEG